MRILLSAYSCGPGRGSEPGVGWNLARQAARFHDVTILTLSDWRESIEAALPSEPQRDRMRFAWLDVPAPFRWMKHRRHVEWLHYYLWQVAALGAARRLHAEQRFDLTHHATYVSWRVPNFLWRLGIPLIWGPVGGGQSIPPGFESALSFRGRLQELARNIANRASSLDPFVRATAERAKVVLAANRETRDFLREAFGVEATILSGVGVAPVPVRLRGAGNGRARLLWAGRLIAWKGIPLLLGALAEACRDVDAELEIVGDGPERKGLERLARELGLERRVTFTGRISHEELRARYGDRDLFVFPSLRETYGMALTEAMAAGLPSVVLDWAGPSALVTDECGIRVPAVSPGQAVRDLAGAIRRLVSDPELRHRMGAAARDRATRTISWNTVGDCLNGIYERAVSR